MVLHEFWIQFPNDTRYKIRDTIKTQDSQYPKSGLKTGRMTPSYLQPAPLTGHDKDLFGLTGLVHAPPVAMAAPKCLGCRRAADWSTRMDTRLYSLRNTGIRDTGYATTIAQIPHCFMKTQRISSQNGSNERSHRKFTEIMKQNPWYCPKLLKNDLKGRNTPADTSGPTGTGPGRRYASHRRPT